jgi:DNA primase
MFLDSLTQNLHQSITRYPEVLKYLECRKVTIEDIKNYGLGFNKIVRVQEEDSPDCKRFLGECDNGKKFENRIVFPLRDMLGSVVGIAGRSVEVKDYKIWATEIAKQTGFFFGLDQALPHIYAENKVFVVEGTFDSIAYAKVFPNTVGTLTSGMNDLQYALLSFFCDSIITVFDSDKAGVLGKGLAGQRSQNFESVEKHATIYPIDLGDYRGVPDEFMPDVVSKKNVFVGKNPSGLAGRYKDPSAILQILGPEKFRELIIKRVNSVFPLFLK